MIDPRPVLAGHRSGAPFDFGTHANDFLLRREQARATETFLVRVPALSAVPEHVHTDMEQTFLFLSGVGEATLTREGDEPVRRTCVPGDMLFVPAGWHHTLVARTIEGVSYVTVNAFLPDAERVGDSAVLHAEIARARFRAEAEVGEDLAPAGALAVFRAAECAFLPDESAQRAWPQDFMAPLATLTRDPDHYRVRRIGPFEYVKTVTPVRRALTEQDADRLFDAAGGLPVFVEGSQSPLSVKRPCSESDLDLLIAVRTTDELDALDGALDDLREAAEPLPVPLSLGVVHPDWLRLPNFYSALSLDPGSPDRCLWQASEPHRLAEAVRRVSEGVALVDDVASLRALLERSLALAGEHDVEIHEWRIVPRWLGYR